MTMYMVVANKIHQGSICQLGSEVAWIYDHFMRGVSKGSSLHKPYMPGIKR